MLVTKDIDPTDGLFSLAVEEEIRRTWRLRLSSEITRFKPCRLDRRVDQNLQFLAREPIFDYRSESS